MAEGRAIKYPIGIQTFSEIIEDGWLYVDKTALVYELANNNKYIFLSRPRRFGKSLLLSTLEAYFQGRKELFEGLALGKLEKEWKKYPVLRLDLSGENYSDENRLIGKIRMYLEKWETEWGLPGSGDSISVRFSNIIHAIRDRAGERVVILIDEYDKPLLENHPESKVHINIKNELRGFYSVLKESDEYIRFAMLTGVTKFGHVSVFSGLNNLYDISMVREFNDICGISESDFGIYFEPSLRHFAEVNNITIDECRTLFKKKYDGYHFVENSEGIYNLYSLLNAFKSEKFGEYWFSTGTPSFLPRLMLRNSFKVDSLEGCRCRANQLQNIIDISTDLVPLLFQAGYLTIKDYDSRSNEYILGLPNEEVSCGFWDSLSRFYLVDRRGQSIFDLNEFVADLQEGGIDAFMTRLRSLMADSDFDHESNKEVHFKNIMAIVTKMLGFRVDTERHAGRGQIDMVVKTAELIYIFEFKINSTPEAAFAQIIDRGYAVPYEADPRPKILIGANFSTETRTLTGWKTEEI